MSIQHLPPQLINQIAKDEFVHEAYEDEVRARMHQAIEQKMQGQEVVIAQSDEPKGQIIDLMAALKASLGEAGTESAVEGGSPPRKIQKKVAPKQAAAKTVSKARKKSKGKRKSG